MTKISMPLRHGIYKLALKMFWSALLIQELIVPMSILRQTCGLMKKKFPEMVKMMMGMVLWMMFTDGTFMITIITQQTVDPMELIVRERLGL